MPVSVKINKNWSKDIQKGIRVGLLDMVTDIHRRASMIAPKDTSALVNSSKITPISNGYQITFGDSRVPYARRRYFENKKNPSSKMYLGKAATSVATGNIARYFRGRV